MARATLRTALCDLLGIEFPVLLAGMGPTVGGGAGGVAGPELVAAVSNAGGLGVLGGTGFPPDEMERQVRRIQDLTDKPFGVDILAPANVGSLPVADQPADGDVRALIPEEHRAAVEAMRERLGLPAPAGGPRPARGLTFDPDGQVDVIVGMGVPVLAVGLGSPAPFADRVHDAGGKILALVGDVRAARRVAKAGADVVVAQGTEAGGHTGRIGTMALLPQVLDAVAPTPVVAAGGIADGRGLAAALAMGCAGVWCGTAFIPTVEAQLDDFRKHRIVDAAAEDTKVTRLYSGKTMRNITNPLIEAWEESGLKALPMGLQSALITDVLTAAKEAGRPELLMNAAGQVSGMLKGIRPAAEVLDQMVAEAAEILARRLPAAVEVRPA